MEGTAEDTIKEQEKGVTSISLLHFTAGAVGRIKVNITRQPDSCQDNARQSFISSEVECSAVHELLGEERRVARHQINIIVRRCPPSTRYHGEAGHSV